MPFNLLIIPQKPRWEKTLAASHFREKAQEIGRTVTFKMTKRKPSRYRPVTPGEDKKAERVGMIRFAMRQDCGPYGLGA